MLHLVTESGGKRSTATLTAGQRHERTQAVDLLEATLERMWADAVAGEKASSTIDHCDLVDPASDRRGVPSRDTEAGPKVHDREAYRERPIIERTINRLTRSRRIATSYEKLATIYLVPVSRSGCRFADRLCWLEISGSVAP